MYSILRGRLNTQVKSLVGRMSGATAASGNMEGAAEDSEGDKSASKNTVTDKDNTVTDKDKKKRDQLAALKQKYESMSVDERRNVYSCGKNFMGLDDVPHWQKTYEAHKYYYEDIAKSVSDVFDVDASLNSKVSLCQGDITKLEIDAIVNAANESLMGGGGVDGAIHRAAGADELHLECYFLNGCATGDAKMTLGYKLPAKFVIHTVGPIGEKPELLASCYKTSLDLAVANNLRTIAFPCISTGIYGYPNKNAAMVVLKTVREWLQANGDSIDRIIFILFLMKDVKIYYSLMPVFFPFPPTEEQKPAEEK